MNIKTTNVRKIATLDQQVFREQAYNLDQYEQMLASNQYWFFLIEQNNEPVGFVILLVSEDNEFELIKIGIINEYQGYGYAYKALDELFNDINYKKIFLEVSANNAKAINLYKKLNFKIIHKRKNYYQDNSDALIMQRINDKYKKAYFLDLNEQIDYLRNQKGLMIDDELKLWNYLKKYNYENVINLYKDFFLDDLNKQKYHYSSTSNGILTLYDFDRQISIKILEEILDIERSVSSAIIYWISKEYKDKITKLNEGLILQISDEEWNLVFPNFIDRKNNIHINKNELTKYLDENLSDLLEKYHKIENIPLWTLSIYWTFGTLIKIFISLDWNLQEKIVQYLAPNHFIQNNEFLMFMLMLNKLRNHICHNDVIYNFEYHDKNNVILNFFIKNYQTNDNECRLFEALNVIDLLNNNALTNSVTTMFEQKFNAYNHENAYNYAAYLRIKNYMHFKF